MSLVGSNPTLSAPFGSWRLYVALLRGVNVGGRTIINMAVLRKLFESCGLTDVTTYIQTGNVLFSANEANPERLARHIEQALAPSIGHPIRVFVLSPAELKEAAAHNPFEPERRDKEQRCHLMFLSDAPEAARWEGLMALQGEEYHFSLHGKVLYYAYSREYDGIRRTIDFEKVLGVTGTARSWKVIDKLIELTG